MCYFWEEWIIFVYVLIVLGFNEGSLLLGIFFFLYRNFVCGGWNFVLGVEVLRFGFNGGNIVGDFDFKIIIVIRGY